MGRNKATASTHVPKKRRSGGASRGETSQNEGETYPTIHFLNEDTHDAYEKRYALRQVLYGRVLDIEFFRVFPIFAWFEVQGWMELLGSTYSIYPNYVKTFFANLEVEVSREGEILKSYVNGTHLRISAEDINAIFRIQSRARRTRETVRPIDAKVDLLGGNAGVRHPQASHLDVPTRIVMLIVNWMVRPITGHMTDLTDIVAVILYNIKHGIYADLGKIMVSHISSVRHYHTANLPYGMWMTPIFEHFGVNLDNTLKTELRGPSRFINERSLKSMGMEKGRNNQWRWKEVEGEFDGGANQAEEGHQDEPEPIQIEMPMGTAGSSSSGYSPYMARFDTIEREVQATRAAVDELGERFDNRMNNFENTMNTNWSTFNQFIHGYMAQYPDYFPPPPPPEE